MSLTSAARVLGFIGWPARRRGEQPGEFRFVAVFMLSRAADPLEQEAGDRPRNRGRRVTEPRRTWSSSRSLTGLARRRARHFHWRSVPGLTG